MEIKVGENFIIAFDEYNWILKEKKVADPNHHLSKSAEPKFVTVGYFSNISHIANNILNRALKSSESNSIQELIETLHQTENKLEIEIKEAVERAVKS